MFYTYILQSIKTKKYYIGSTNNLYNRLLTHNSGGSSYTKRDKPWIIVYFENFNSRPAAVKREKEIKNYKGGNSFKKLIKLQ